LVDDEPSVARALGRILTAAGCDVEAHGDGDLALRALAQKSFDVVVSDIHLPGITGVELLRRIRTYDLDIPVILLTGYPRLETAIEAVELGALKYLAKPVDHDELVGAVERAVRLHRIARAKRDAFALFGQNTFQPGDRAGLIAAFDRALDTLWPAFQPIVDTKGRVVAYEALMRSQEPSLPQPGAVLSAAEALGRVHDVGARMRARIADAFGAASEDVMLFVNLHPQDLVDPELCDPHSPLGRFAKRVVLEVTERASLEQIRDLPSCVRRLRDLGYRLALDDLGAGYAGLTSFSMLEPDIVKLDMSLVRGIDGSEVRRRIVGSMAMLCNQLGMNVVAEGIETAAERDAVAELGCNWQQGFLYAKPGPAFPELAPLAT
jgi:EAL domain-containing protein (putative c-di-GMP-specific phosphodiesterase class I)